MTTKKKAWLNGGLFITTLIVNALGALGFINGLSQKDISDKYLTLITPAPTTFSIWSVIYILLAISIVLMIFKSEDRYYKTAIEKTSGLFIFSCVLNIAWIVFFSYLQLLLSTVFILLFSVTLALICTRLLEIGDKKHFLLPLTFGLYGGWVFIASVVNIAATLVKWDWNGFGLSPEVLASGTLIVAILMVFYVTSQIHNAVFPLPIAWAYFGINMFLRSSTGFNGKFVILEWVSLIGIVLYLVMSAFQFYKNQFKLVQ